MFDCDSIRIFYDSNWRDDTDLQKKRKCWSIVPPQDDERYQEIPHKTLYSKALGGFHGHPSGRLGALLGFYWLV